MVLRTVRAPAALANTPDWEDLAPHILPHLVEGEPAPHRFMIAMKLLVEFKELAELEGRQPTFLQAVFLR